MYYIIITLILLIIILIILIPLKVIVFINLDYYEFRIYNIKIYQKKFLEINDINKERKSINFLKIFKIIDIQNINLEIGGFTNYFYRAINYGIIHIIFNILSFVIQDQFVFNYKLDFNSNPKFNFTCIIKSNVGRIIVGLLKEKLKWENIQLMIY